jgi:DNA-binding transcriptional MerR regulator
VRRAFPARSYQHLRRTSVSFNCIEPPILHGTLRTLRMVTESSETFPMTTTGIRTNAAAVMLGVSPNTLRSWERRYGFPRPHRSPGGHRQFALPEIEALRLALAETHNVSSAVSLARERGEGPSSASRLTAAFAAFDEDQSGRLLAESLTLKSIERAIEEILLEAVVAHHDPDRITPEYEFAWRYATGWLSALKRLSPPAMRPEGILLLDASAALDLDALHAQALELVLRRAGVRTLLLSPAIDPARLGRALRALDPAAVILTGRRVTLDAIGRLVYAVRGVVHEVAVFDYRGAVPDTGASTVVRLGEMPTAARDLLFEWLERPQPPRRQPVAVALRSS